MPKITSKLSETAIKSAKPKSKGYYLLDGERLRLLVRPTGKKVWQYHYQRDGKANVYTIGTYPVTGTADARRERDKVKKLLDQGIDPNQNKKDQQLKHIATSKNTFEAIAREWYGKQNWAEKHAKNILNRLEKDVFPILGRKPVAEVTVPDIMVVLKKIEERKALDVAKRVNQYCSAIFDYAIVQGLCDMNPALGRAKFIQSYKAENRDHLKENDLPEFLEALENDEGHRLINLAVRLLMLTFLRPGELRGARWDEIDEKKKIWTIPAGRMKMNREHLVPLSCQALTTIAQIREISGNYEILFPGRVRAHKPISDVALIKAVKRLTKDKATPHGFRHTASTILNENSFDIHHVERQLAHVDGNKVRDTYNKALYLEDRKKMMQWWADYLEGKAESISSVIEAKFA